ncbi:MAG: transposase [Pseudomonadota bacterium]
MHNRVSTARIWTHVREERPWGSTDPPAAWYAFTANRKGEHPAAHLASFKGRMRTDDTSGFDELHRVGTIHGVACLAHIRRKFVPLSDASHRLLGRGMYSIRRAPGVAWREPKKPSGGSPGWTPSRKRRAACRPMSGFACTRTAQNPFSMIWRPGWRCN